MKKVLIHVGLIISIFIIYFLQSNFFNWFTIAGVMPNLFIVLVLFIGLFGNRSMGTIYGIVIGLFLDYLFCSKIGINACLYGIVGFIATIFNKNFSKDSRITIMVMVVAVTAFFEIGSYLLNYIIFSTYVETWFFVRILMVEVVFNIFITIIIYPMIRKFGYLIENEYKGSQILTRYF